MFRSIISTTLDLLFPPACRICDREGAWLCQRCLELPSPITIDHPASNVAKLLALGSYDHRVLARAVQELKYTGGRVLVEPLGKAISETFRSQMTADVIVAVPLHRSRQRERGFNQAELLAKSIGRHLDIPVQLMVKRIRRTMPQVTLNEAERQHNMHDAFALMKGVESIPKRGIIIDDVFTTGATISEVARVLRAAGMKHVIALTVAKG